MMQWVRWRDPIDRSIFDSARGNWGGCFPGREADMDDIMTLHHRRAEGAPSEPG